MLAKEPRAVSGAHAERCSSNGAAPPVPQVAADELDQADIEALYLAIADQWHIEMIGKMDKDGKVQKYTTVHRQLLASDIAAHIAGTKTVGSHLAHQDGTARLFCKDADSEEKRALLRAGARKLAAAGFFPLLESAPADKPLGIPGYHDVSEHGWILLDQAHDFAATWSAIHAIAPEWKELDEQWPGSAKRVRLPAGKYIMPGYSAWCVLSSVSDGEIAEDGQEAARLLLSHQSPASLIPELPALPQDEQAAAGGAGYWNHQLPYNRLALMCLVLMC
jgi:hypothetical protein